MRNIYVDLGCYDGDSIREFYHWCSLKSPKDHWIIFGVDPNPLYENIWHSMQSENPSLHFIRSAAWIEDGILDYTLKMRDMGSSVVPEKDGWAKGQVIKTPCFDLSAWIKEMANHEDFLLVKMDIEGAEFEVLEKMIKDNTIFLIDHLMIEWHDTKMTGEFTDRRLAIEEQLQQLGVKYSEW